MASHPSILTRPQQAVSMVALSRIERRSQVAVLPHDGVCIMRGRPRHRASVPATDMARPKPTPVAVYSTLQLVWGSNEVWHGVHTLQVEQFDT